MHSRGCRRPSVRFIRHERSHAAAPRNPVGDGVHRRGNNCAAARCRSDDGATLWFLTVIGLCMGGGQITLGLAGAALGIFVLSGLKFVENRLARERRGSLSIVTTPAGPGARWCNAGGLESSSRPISTCFRRRSPCGRSVRRPPGSRRGGWSAPKRHRSSPGASPCRRYAELP